MPGRNLRVQLLRKLTSAWPWLLVVFVLLGVRLSKGAGLTDAYALLTRPFWPGSAQSEWLRAAQQLERQTGLQQLQADNQRLRGMLELDRQGVTRVSAPVISREPGGWWQQLELGKGSLDGLSAGDPVLAPGGFIGRISSVTPSTARVQLLTDGGSRIGVWVSRVQRHALLVGQGTPRPRVEFLEKDTGVRPGDVITTSPASTLVPPNLLVGVVQTVNDDLSAAPDAVVQLSAPVDAVDWVQVVTR